MCFSLTMSMWSFFAPIPAGMRMVYALGGVLLFSFFIVYDTQLIVGGAHKVRMRLQIYEISYRGAQA